MRWLALKIPQDAPAHRELVSGRNKVEDLKGKRICSVSDREEAL